MPRLFVAGRIPARRSLTTHSETPAMLKHLHGPEGIRILLDATEIFPEDPGAGTPAMVFVGKHSGTYWCALDTGELVCGNRDYTLSNAQHRWLDNQFDTVSEFLAAHSK